MQFSFNGAAKSTNGAASAAKNGVSWAGFRGRLVACGRGIVAVFRYIFFFEWVVDIARWLITTGGNIAESAFLLATVYVTINTVAHQLMLWAVAGNDAIIKVLNQVSVIAFSVLPELIVIAAIKVTFDHYKMALSSKRVDSWVWAIAYSLPTLIFLALTVVTISSFVNVEGQSANAVYQATGIMLVVRCLSGWSYGMLQMLWDKLGHEGYSNLFARLRGEVANLTVTVKARDTSITGLERDKNDLEARVTDLLATVTARDVSILDFQAQIEEEKKQHSTALGLLRGSLQAEISTLQSQGSTTDRLVKARDAQIASLKDELEELKEQNSTLDSELVEARIALARRSGSAVAGDSDSEEVISEAVVNSEKYQKVKKLMQQQLSNGQKINMKKISTDTGISYNTIRRYSQSILNSLVA